MNRFAAARWIKAARRIVREAGNRIECVHPGVMYLVRNAEGRGLAVHHFDYSGRMVSEEIA